MSAYGLRFVVVFAAAAFCLVAAGCFGDGGSDPEGDVTQADVGGETPCEGPDGSCVEDCTPYCVGKECGDDGCDGSCGNCFSKEGAVDNTLCSADGVCLDCLPYCEGRECGDDGCGGNCGNCFTVEGAMDNSMCQADGTCSQCSPDCTGKACGDNGCGGSCGDCPAGEACALGACHGEDALCPSGQQCLEIADNGDLACLEGGEIPAGAQTQCHEMAGGCPGNAACMYLDEEGNESVCVENCGECPSNLTCGDVTGDGYLGCMQGGSIPANAQTQCHEGAGCAGNFTCFYVNQARTESVCIENCSPCQPGSCPVGEVCDGTFCVPEPCTEGSCGDGEICLYGTCIPDIGPGPGAFVDKGCDLPPLECEGTKAYCDELIQFEPVEGYGYIDYPENGESYANQYRSWLRREGFIAIKYAAAKVACYADDWEFGNGGPIGLIDMSEENGDIPGTSVGSAGHPNGTHEDGQDIDVAYYQVNTSDNRARPICDHYEAGSEAHHCTAPPHLLDPWREALFLGALFEHPRMRVIGCDGQAGTMIIGAMENLCENGWLGSYACNNVALAYETVNTGAGWYLFHHHHVHVSFKQSWERDSEGTATTPSSECLVPGCLNEPLKHFLTMLGLGKGLPKSTTGMTLTHAFPARKPGK